MANKDSNTSRKRGSNEEDDANALLEKVIKIDRVNKVVKGGKRLAFRAFTIVGDQKGEVGYGLGKSKEVPVAIRKGIERSKKYMKRINIVNDTLPHEVKGKFSSSMVLIRPARPGTGVIAGGAVKILLECVGIKDVVAKSYGSRNPINMVKAAMVALLKCRDLKHEEKIRGKKLPVYFGLETKDSAAEPELVEKGK